MPELPEVRTVSKHLNNKLKGLTIKSIDVRLSKMLKDIDINEFIKRTVNKKIISITNEGKWILFNLEGDEHIIVHLRLEGKFRTIDDPHINPKHDHVIIEFNNGVKLFFNDTRQFGTFHLKGSEYKDVKPLVDLGKSFKDLSPEWLHQKLSNKRIPIKSALLDQTIVIGLGNIYVNEVLWECKIDPTIPSNQIALKQIKEIIKWSHDIMEESYIDGGSSIQTYSSLDGKKGTYQNKLKVHMKEKEKCPKCATSIIKIKVGGRGTYLCPKCQNYKK